MDILPNISRDKRFSTLYPIVSIGVKQHILAFCQIDGFIRSYNIKSDRSGLLANDRNRAVHMVGLRTDLVVIVRNFIRSELDVSNVALCDTIGQGTQILIDNFPPSNRIFLDPSRHIICHCVSRPVDNVAAIHMGIDPIPGKTIQVNRAQLRKGRSPCASGIVFLISIGGFQEIEQRAYISRNIIKDCIIVFAVYNLLPREHVASHLGFMVSPALEDITLRQEAQLSLHTARDGRINLLSRSSPHRIGISPARFDNLAILVVEC